MSGNSITTAQNASIQTVAIDSGTLERYVSFLDVKSRTLKTYERALFRFFNFLKANGNTTAPSRADVLAFRKSLEDEELKPATRQNYIIAVRQFFKWTASEGIYPNIADKIKGAKVDPFFKRDHLAKEQLEDVLRCMGKTTETEKRDFAMVCLMASCALRTIEVSRARIEDIGKMGGQLVLFVQGKGRDEKSDFVRLSSIAGKAISAYLEARGATDKKEPLFTSTSNNSKGKPLTTRTISGVVKASFLKAGYDSARLTAHSLRHTAVTLALLGGMGIDEAKDFARHQNIATTQIYAHHIKRENNRCVDVLDGIIERMDIGL